MQRLGRALLAALVMVVAPAGCTSRLDQPPPPAPAPTRDGPDPCAKPTIRVVGASPDAAQPDLLPARPGGPTVTGVYERFTSADVQRYTELLDAPVVPVLTWESRPPGVDDDAVWSALEAQAGANRRPSEGLTEAKSMMDGLRLARGTYLAYVGVGRRAVRFTAMCGGRLYAGAAETWTVAEGGVLSCAQPVADAGPMTRRVHADYC